ncbi:thymidylate synthase [Aphanizomenon flos-aquae NRERC-008]|uniref:Thymidylate synthase n=1 Tax=Aphanizomenon flos-aquae FACHB-1249 TaxID=2692889 RepID=A0ABR8IQ48_APHFL|nr:MULTISPECIES: thymidylate synthase [Aphanizomenon]MBD2390309.1 thymidylate synthase [Aphanizomenon flos-aquae FACHB-1171]MBD2555592.1 thymidylate synthase [Aphanizomenon flos-aquae FACHB-1290]MBD2631409.1 thymidylate synthase [Aphanizomenon sp. FACHB-1399]MBD2655722.1 thymidylate synthase [Aphanizomenon flos-aquae FACHB-1265]MBD2674604.1 thymidylate synthase [Aphanizomenon flos-aquae FACHB-1416]MBD2685453.1 thymidylate synthase [Aphanizomenon flos-aquae FACHB-1249]
MSKQITQFYYTAEHKPNQLIYGSGQTAVITGWTVKETLRKHLKDNEYAVIGQLYSPTRGINLLIRNLLLNPHVRYLVILNATKEDKNAGACQCLGDFFRYGVEASISDTGRKSWVIRSLIPGYIDIDIDINALEKLRHSVEIQDAISISDAVEKIQYYTQKETVAPWGIPLQFPMNIVEPTVFPGTRYGHRIEGKTIAETWVKIIHRIKTTGTIRPTGYDGKWQELIDLMAVVTEEPDDFYFPEPNYLPIDRSFLEEYISQILDDAINQEGVKYTYGQRLRSWFGRDQIEQVIEKLIGEIDAASAVMTLWDVKDHEKGGSPCLNHIWLRVVDNELSLTAVLRSNDMFAAWPANAMGLRALQKHIRNEICQRSQYDLKLGPLITLSQSAHIYDDTWSNAEQLIKEQYSAICKKLDYYDPAGNFLIEIADDKIVVTHTTPGSGEIVGCYSGKNPLKMIKEICAALPAIRPDHAGYLGMELQKAANCLKIDKSYIQDR